VSRIGALLALFMPGLLLLSACASGQPDGADASSPGSLASASSHPEARGVAESVRVGGFTQLFAMPLPANSGQAKVMSGFRKAQILWIKSEAAWRLVAPVTDYVTGDALAHLTVAMKAIRKAGIVPAGSDRYFMIRITIRTARTATVTTCDDGSKYRARNRRTGKIEPAPPPPPDQKFLFETWRMVRLSGHWAITSFSVVTLPDPRAKPCQP
jgi:hypothetical protein